MHPRRKSLRKRKTRVKRGTRLSRHDIFQKYFRGFKFEVNNRALETTWKQKIRHRVKFWMEYSLSILPFGHPASTSLRKSLISDLHLIYSSWYQISDHPLNLEGKWYDYIFGDFSSSFFCMNAAACILNSEHKDPSCLSHTVLFSVFRQFRHLNAQLLFSTYRWCK